MCDLSTLKLESGRFIEDNLCPYYSDVLYSLKTTQGDGYIYALIEHLCNFPPDHGNNRHSRYHLNVQQAAYRRFNPKIKKAFN